MDDAALHCRAETLDVARRGNRDHVNPRRPCLADRAQHFQSGDVRQIDVKENQVGPRRGDQSQGIRAGSGLTHDREARHLLDVSAMQSGDPEVVVHDKGADHPVSTAADLAASGNRTVKTAPPWFTTVTAPPRRAATCLTSARPSPRREPGPANLVV